MARRKWTDEELASAVNSSYSIAQVIRKLGLIPAGGEYFAIKQKIKELGLDVSHMTGQRWNKGKQIPKRPLDEILIKDSPIHHTNSLKKRLLRNGIKEAKCECCGLTEWMGKPINLELHHINGIRNDNRIENLQILCPNCHSCTDNYRKQKSSLS